MHPTSEVRHLPISASQRNNVAINGRKLFSVVDVPGLQYSRPREGWQIKLITINSVYFTCFAFVTEIIHILLKHLYIYIYKCQVNNQ